MNKPSRTSRQERPRKSKGQRNSLRIIGGRWRGRQLSFPDQEGLRPTGDRIRETLFNWLTPHIPHAHCLDLFSGSGALSFEAVSRGAASATLLDSSAHVCRVLRVHRESLHAERAIAIVQTDAIQWLREAADRQFDIVFVDPPFGSSLLQPALESLKFAEVLHSGSLVYVECALEQGYQVPSGWHSVREKQAGQVSYRLLEIEAG